jgi:prophage DNA circulation protein
MSLFRSVSDILPGLSPASFRGVRFEAVNIEHEVGRRLVTHFFPGVDAQAREDQGELRGPITVNGFVIGDDYIARARVLEAALLAPGPGTLSHPWRGEMRVVVPAGAKISFTSTELRVMRFQATFEPEGAGLAAGLSTLSRLTGALDAIRSAAAGFVLDVLTARSVPVLALSVAADMLRETTALATKLATRAPNGVRLTSVLEILAADFARTPSAALASRVVSDLPQALIAAARPNLRPAIAPGGASPPVRPDPMPPREGSRLALAIAADIDARPFTMAADEVARASMHAATVSAAAAIAARIPFESREEALAWRGDLDRALERAAGMAAALTTRAPGPASRLYSAITDARSGLGADFNQIIGRLPRTRIMRAPGVPVMLIAYDLAGDDPGRVLALAAEITRRNRIAHPAFTPDEGVEVLR